MLRKQLKSVDRRRMSFQGLIIHFLTYMLPIICCIMNYYVVNDKPLSSNLTCKRYNQYFIHCSTLVASRNNSVQFQQNLLSRPREQDINYLQFFSLEFLEPKARNSTIYS